LQVRAKHMGATAMPPAVALSDGVHHGQRTGAESKRSPLG
jgi:hypothetical protein